MRPYYVLEGEMQCTVGETTHHAKAGDVVFLPRYVEHSWKTLIEPTRFLVWISPAGSEQVFLKFSEPALTLNLPTTPPDETLMEEIVAMDNAYGVVYAFQTELQ